MEHRKRRTGILALSVSAALLMAGAASAENGNTGGYTPAELAELRPAEPLKVCTWEGIPYSGQFPGGGADGMYYTTAEPPRHGTVAVNGNRFTFTPQDGFTGVDRFTYTVTDRDGAATLPGRATVFVGRRQVRYADLEDSPAASAAQELAEEGVYTGERIGDRYYFGPDKALSREEFLAMAMEALGREAADGLASTGFCDDGAISAWVRAYAAAGETEGIVRGFETALGAAFQGDAPVTWSQAAAILSRSLHLEDADLSAWTGAARAVTNWAAQEAANLEAAGVIPAGSFGSLTMEEALTRADAAQLLSAARAVLKNAPASAG